MVPSPPNEKQVFCELIKDILDDVAVQTPEQVEAFRQALYAELRATFDAMPVDRQMIATALYGRRPEELEKIEKTPCRSAALHDFRGTLNFVLNGVRGFREKLPLK